MYKLLIVEDEAHEREGLLGFLDWKALGIEVVGAASDGEEGIALARRLLPDIVISDIRMPQVDGIEMIRNIRVFLPELEAIISSGHDEFAFARSAIQVGVTEYLLKPVERRSLVEALEACRKKIEARKRAAFPDIAFDSENDTRLRNLENALTKLSLSIRSLDPGRVGQSLSAVGEHLGPGGYTGAEIVDSLSRWMVGVGRELSDAGLRADQSIGDVTALFDEIRDLAGSLAGEVSGYASPGVSGETSDDAGPVSGGKDILAFLRRVASQAQNAIRNRSGDRKTETVREVLTAIETGYGNPIGLKTISEAIGVSPNYLGKIFTEVTGMPFNEYLSRYRLEKARGLLGEGVLKVQAVAEAVGYPNVPYFCTLFKNTYGISPAQYQKKLD